MCYSFEASMTSAVTLTLCSALIIKKIAGRKKYLGIGLIPLFFGIQQFLEGMLWLNLDNVEVGNFYARCYLFFSSFFWPIYGPLSIYILDNRVFVKKSCLALAFMGFLLGLYLFVPVLLDREKIFTLSDTTSEFTFFGLHRFSFSYTTYLNNTDIFPKSILNILKSIYTFIVVFPLVISQNKFVVFYGYSLFLAIIFTNYLYQIGHFLSVWCFIAAFLSLILYFAVPKKIDSNS